MKITLLLQNIPYYHVTQSIDQLEVKGVSMDSRSTNPGDLFVCIRGAEADGHHYASKAVDRGAVAIVAEQPVHVQVPVIIVNDTVRALAMVASAYYEYPSSRMEMIGITGTNGKTTISYLMEDLFNKNKQRTGIIGTIQVKINDQVFPIRNTTPDALTIQHYLAKMKKTQVDTAIMEVSSHALDQGRVFGVDFDVAVFTNLTRDHLDYHDHFEDYLRAKSLLFAQLGNGYNKGQGKFAVINQDSPYASKMKRSTSQAVLTYGVKQTADIQAMNYQLKATGCSFLMKTPKGSLEIESPLIGLFNIYNMLAVAAVGTIYNIPLQTIKLAFEQTKGVRGRFESVREGQEFGVIVDYAHTPDSLENVLQAVSGFCKGAIRVVVGCGGDRDRKKRPMMADAALKYGDQVIFTTDNPRTEPPKQIFKDMTAHLEGGYEIVYDREKAIECAISKAKEGDLVLIAGKGHETYQEINGVRNHFDDCEVARRILKRRKENLS